MKKTVSLFLTVCMTVALLLPCLVLSAGAAVTAPHPTKVVYDYSDWDDHCMINDKWTLLSTGVIGINGDPALAVTPLKQNTSSGNPAFSWNHFSVPYVFDAGKNYVVSFDATLLSQVGKDTPDPATSTWQCVVTNSNHTATVAGSPNDWAKIPVKGADGGDLVVAAEYGKWSHFVGSISRTGSNTWQDSDCIFFWEAQVDGDTAASQIAIDNLVIMDKDAYDAAYPDGVPARTDTPAVDMIAANFNSTRYMPFLDAAAPTKVNATTVLDGDGRLKWNYKKDSNVYSQFNFEAGKTYHLSFDAILNNSHAEAYPGGVTLNAVAMGTRAGVAADGVEAFTGANKVKSGEWTHLDLTLTPAQAHSFFGMAVQENADVVVWIDNYKLYVDGKEPSCPTTPRVGADNPANYRVLSDFEGGRNMLFSGNWWWNSVNEIVTLENGNKVQKVSMKSWAKNYGFMSFTKEHTYVLSFDVYGVSELTGRSFSVYGKQAGSTLFDDPNSGLQFACQNADGTLNGNFEIVPGEWRHYNATMTVNAGSVYYFMLLMGDVGDNYMDFYLDNLTIVEKTGGCDDVGHTAGLWVSDVIPSCQNEGHAKLTCAICGAQMEEKTLPKTHVMSDRIVVKEPDCTNAGSYKYECISCHETLESGEIPALGHTLGEWETVEAADCKKAGQEQVKCTVCGEVVNTKVIPQLQHIEGKWIVDKEAAPGVAGHRYKTCTLCGETVREEDIEALPVESDTNEVSETTPVSGTEKTDNVTIVGCESAFGGVAGILATLAAAGVMLGRRRKH